jgi:hypothetical protein
MPGLGAGESFCRIGTIGAAVLAAFAVETGFLRDVFLAGLFAVARSLVNCFPAAFASSSAALIALNRSFSAFSCFLQSAFAARYIFL